VRNAEGIEALKDVNFDMRKGEILGVAGIAGADKKNSAKPWLVCTGGKGAILYYKQNIVGKNSR
jgi:simple sugar transport system ATP-binding protein